MLGRTKPESCWPRDLGDGSSFAVIPTLQAEGYEVVAAQHSLDVSRRATREESKSKLRCLHELSDISARTSLA